MVKSREFWWIELSGAILLVFSTVNLLACSSDQRNYIALGQEGQYLFGVWNTHSEKAAVRLIGGIAQAGVQEKAQLPSLPIKTSENPVDLLPEDGDIPDWVRSRNPSGYTAKNLYKDTIGGHPELYHAYGVIEQAEVEYQTPLLRSYPLIRVEIFDMGAPENAFGIYSFNQYPEAESEWVGNRAVITGKFLRFWKGKYYVEIEGYEFATKVEEGMIELAKSVASRIKDSPTKPQLVKLLPVNRIPHSVKYFFDDTTLRKIYNFLPEDGLRLGDNATGASASCVHKKNGIEHWAETAVAFLIRYPSESVATDAYNSYRVYLETQAVSVNSLEGRRIVIQLQ